MTLACAGVDPVPALVAKKTATHCVAAPFAEASCHKYSTYSASWLQDAARCYQLLEHAE